MAIVRSEPGADLRNRVAGARRLETGINPYLAPSRSLPEFYRSFTPTSASPAHLLLYIPLAKLDYSVQRWIYFALDWVLVATVFWLLRRIIPGQVSTPVLLYLYSALLVLDAAFLMHFARGQLYLELLFFTGVVSTGLVKRDCGWPAPIAMGVLVLLRPTYLIVVLAAALLGSWTFVRRAAMSVAALAVIVVALTGVGAWREYAAMVGQARTDHVAIASLTWHPAVTDPVIEGRNYLHSRSFGGWEWDRTLIGLTSFPRLRWIALEHARALLTLNSLLLVLFAAVMLMLVWRMRTGSPKLAQVGMVLLIPIVIESFGPQRYAYSDVTLSLPLVMAAAMLTGDRPRTTLWSMAGALVYVAMSRVNIGIPLGPLSVVRFGATVVGLAVLFALKKNTDRSQAVEF